MIQTLLITGANNHEWQRSAPFCKDVLERSGKFAVTLTETPAEALADKDALARYQLLFLDYNGPAWGEPAQQNFLDAVRGGIGVTVLHAADNAFPGWVEYEKMVGLLWREGTGHGACHRFAVKVVDHDHPITRGMPDAVDHWDELYHDLVHMHDVPLHVLATAYSSPDQRGTGKDEPVLIVTTYGQGRVFHNALGHVWTGSGMDAFEDPWFQQSLIRGSQWAATGEVS